MIPWEFSATILLGVLGIRTALWWLQNWQLREYRTDRLQTHLYTSDARKNLWNLWFFRGLLPRPKLSGRIILILLIFAITSGVLVFTVQKFYSIFWTALIWERTIFLTMGISVLISSIPVMIQKQRLYSQAKKIIESAPHITRIGITGSYGKSSTKKILVHLLHSKFGKENVLTNPGNENNEIAIARLIIKNKSFFSPSSQKRGAGGVLIIEIGAYRKGEIENICRFLGPKIGIITGLNAQHAALFGSTEVIRQAKFELAENTSKKVFFNADTPSLVEIFGDKKIHATSIPISLTAAKNISATADQTAFEAFGEKFVLPWGGKFFVGNALLAIECAREIAQLDPAEIGKALRDLPPLSRALNVQKLKSGTTILQDLYSANPDGVLGAIDHLGTFPGRKIFVGIPLRELGNEAKQIHEQIFSSLKRIDAEIFWLRKDFEDLGLKICGKHFHGSDLKKLKNLAHSLSKNDAVLLESKLPKEVVKIFD